MIAKSVFGAACAAFLSAIAPGLASAQSANDPMCRFVTAAFNAERRIDLPSDYLAQVGAVAPREAAGFVPDGVVLGYFSEPRGGDGAT